MSSRDPVAEWRERWTTQPYVHARPQPKPPRSPWVYAAAAFAGTMVAIVGSIAACVAGIIILAMNADGLDSTPESLTYRNDTQDDVWVYECYERCEDFGWGFWIATGDEESFQLEWYDGEAVEWVVVTFEDYSYECIQISDWEDQILSISDADSCPPDIHSPDVDTA